MESVESSAGEGANEEERPGCSISHERLDSGTWLFVIEGEVDLASADRVRDALTGVANNGGGSIVVDLAECSFIDSSGLRALLEARRSLEGDGGAPGLLIAAPAEQPRRLFEMSSVETVMPVFKTRDEAQAAARRALGDGSSPASR